jgi:K+-transporting ATPase ATPase C chain
MDRFEIIREAKTCVLLFALVCVLSLAFPFFVTFVAEKTMPYQAHGSLIYVNGTVVGSELIGQSFTSPGYFHGRPSAVDYNGSNSGGSNLGPTSAKLMLQVRQRVENVREENNLPPNATVPADLVLASASGLDPHISPASALLQVPRVAKARGLPESKVRTLVEEHIEPLQYGLFGQERVNVLKLNIALDELTRGSKQ